MIIVFHNSVREPGIPGSRFRCLGRNKYIFLVVCVTFALSIGSTLSQRGLNNLYNFERGIDFAAVKVHGDHLFVFGNMLDSSVLQSVFVALIDTNGTLIRWTTISDPAGVRHVIANQGVDVCSTNTGGLAVTFSYSDSPDFGIAVLDSNLEIQINNAYTVANDLQTNCDAIYQLSNGEYLITGHSSRPSFDIDVFVMKGSITGERTWMYYYGSPNVDEIGFEIVQVGPNEYVIGGRKGVDSHIFAIDSLGVLKWEWTNDGTLNDSSVDGLQKEANGNWAYFSFFERLTTNLPNQYNVSTPIFIRRDTNMQILEYKAIDPFAALHRMSQMIHSDDGGWIAAGTTSNFTDDHYADNGAIFGRVIKLDTNGNIIWSLQDTAVWIPPKVYSGYLSDVAESPSGSIYAVGYTNAPNEDGIIRSYGWLLKISADGCVDTLCNTTFILDQISSHLSEVIVYPNPATDHVTVKIPEGIRDATISFYDLQGQFVMSQDIRSGENLVSFDQRITPGVYLWRVNTAAGRIIDSGKLIISK